MRACFNIRFCFHDNIISVPTSKSLNNYNNHSNINNYLYYTILSILTIKYELSVYVIVINLTLINTFANTEIVLVYLKILINENLFQFQFEFDNGFEFQFVIA